MSNMNAALVEMVQQYRRALEAIRDYRFHVPPTPHDVIAIKRIAREAEEQIPRIERQD